MILIIIALLIYDSNNNNNWYYIFALNLNEIDHLVSITNLALAAGIQRWGMSIKPQLIMWTENI